MRTFKKLSRCRSTSSMDNVNYNNRSTYHRDYTDKAEFTFNAAQNEPGVYKRQPNFAPEKKMLCPDCLNKTISQNKKDAPTEKEQAGTSLNDPYSMVYQKKVIDKVKAREQLSKQASTSLPKYKDDKIEKLQNENENDNFYANAKDHRLERANRRYKNNQDLINSHLDQFKPKENEQLKKYYDNYVGKGNENIIKTSPNIPCKNEKFIDECKKQLQDHLQFKQEREKKEKEEDEKIMKLMMKQYQDELKKQNERDQRNMKAVNDANKRMIDEHNRQREMDKLNKQKEADELAKLGNKRIEEEKLNDQKKREEMNRVCNDNLKKFLKDKEEREKNKEQEKINDRKYKGLLCPHGCDMAQCDMCRGMFPKRMLTPVIFRRKKNLKY